MRIALCFALLAVRAIGQADLDREDTRDIQRVFKSSEASLDTFHVRDKKPIAGMTAVVLVDAQATELLPGARYRSPVAGSKRIGVFVVEGSTNRVRRTIDIFSFLTEPGSPALDPPTAREIRLHLYGSYGLYQGSINYFYDLDHPAPPVKIRYAKLALTGSSVRKGAIEYTASFGEGNAAERNAVVTIEPRAAAVPAFRMVDAAADRSYAPPAPVRAANGETVLVENKTPPGQQHRPSIIYVTNYMTDRVGVRQAYPAPVTTLELYRRTRPQDQTPAEIESDIGPYVIDGSRIWFAGSFYDGEGVSGVGTIGLFDLTTRKYEMRYLPEIASWSGSAMRLDGDELWIGLVRHPEGADLSGGLLRYNVRTGAVKKFHVPDAIFTLDVLDGVLYCGTSDGFYTIRGDRVAQFHFEPDAQGKTELVLRN